MFQKEEQKNPFILFPNVCIYPNSLQLIVTEELNKKIPLTTWVLHVFVITAIDQKGKAKHVFSRKRTPQTQARQLQ